MFPVVTWALGGVLVLLAPVATGQSGGPEPRPDHPPAWGTAVGGLRVGVRAAGPGVAEVVLENTGEEDLTLDLGLALANGRRHLPTAVRLALTDAAGKAHPLGLREPGVAGRVDPFVVPLPAGGRYTLRCRLADYAAGDAGLLPAGRYRATAEFSGAGVTRTNPDAAHLALLRYWVGTATSGGAELIVPERTGP